MASNVKWHPQKFISKMDSHLEKNLDIAAEWLQSDIQSHFPGRGKSSTGTGYVPSKDGEIPSKQTGALKKSIRWERGIKKFTRRVGSIIKGYPFFLEIGTRKMGKRPYIRPAIYGRGNPITLKKLITRPMI